MLWIYFICMCNKCLMLKNLPNPHMETRSDIGTILQFIRLVPYDTRHREAMSTIQPAGSTTAMVRNVSIQHPSWVFFALTWKWTFREEKWLVYVYWGLLKKNKKTCICPKTIHHNFLYKYHTCAMTFKWMKSIFCCWIDWTNFKTPIKGVFNIF